MSSSQYQAATPHRSTGFAAQRHRQRNGQPRRHLAAQNLIIPVGTQKIGRFEYNVLLNSAPSDIDALNNLPNKTVNGTLPLEEVRD